MVRRHIDRQGDEKVPLGSCRPRLRLRLSQLQFTPQPKPGPQPVCAYSFGPCWEELFEHSNRLRLGASLAAALVGTRRVLARQGRAGENVGLFDHPAH